MSLAPRTPQANNKPVLDKRHEVQEAGLASTSTHPVTVLDREAPVRLQRGSGTGPLTKKLRLKDRSGSPGPPTERLRLEVPVRLRYRPAY